MKPEENDLIINRAYARANKRKNGEWRNEEEYLVHLRHMKAYDFALKYIKNKSVLDIGCGSGYGTAFLSRFSSKATGIDISKELIQYSKKRYRRKNLEFRHVGSRWMIDGLPFYERSFDACVSFQVIEHIHPNNIDGFLSEIRKILKKGGLLIVSTPNSRLRLLPFQKPWNQFHIKEYDDKGFSNLLMKKFSKVEMFGMYGTKRAYMNEYKRVKQSPINVYVIRPSVRVFKFFSPSLSVFLKSVYANRRKSKKNRVREDNSFLESFSLKNFRVFKPTEKSLKTCLDLVCVCYK